MVQIPEGEPSTVEVDITYGSTPKVEPSTLETNIMDGSESKAEPSTLGGMNRGWFGVQSGTFHAEPQYRGWFNVDGVNRPR